MRGVNDKPPIKSSGVKLRVNERWLSNKSRSGNEGEKEYLLKGMNRTIE